MGSFCGRQLAQIILDCLKILSELENSTTAAVFCIFFVCAVFGWFFGYSSVQTRSCTAWFKIWFRQPPPPPYRSLCSDAWRAGEAIQRLELCGAQLVARFGGFEFRASSVDKLSTLKF